MADNTTLNTGTGGDVIRTKDRAGTETQIIGIDVTVGSGTENLLDDASGKRLPVKIGDPIPAGTNNIGDVDVLTLPALPAGTNNIGDVDVLTLPKSASAAITSVNDTATSTTLLSSNASRLGFSIFNDSTEILYVKFGTTASSTDYNVKLQPQGYFEDAFRYTGRVDGIWANDASGAAKIAELT